MAAVLLPIDTVGNIECTPSPGLSRRPVLRAGDGRCSADTPPRPCLRRICELRPGASFVCRLTRAFGKVLGRRGRHTKAVECLLFYRKGGWVVRTLAPGVLVEVVS